MPPMTGPNSPPTSTVWLTLVLPSAGSIRQLKRNFVPGTTLVSSAKLRPGCTSTSFILWCWPARVFITPVEPYTNPPAQSIVKTFGFHSPQVDISDQIRQTWSGDAMVSTEVPYSRAIDSSPSGRSCGGQLLMRHVDYITRLQEIESYDAGHQEHGAQQLDRAQGRALSNRRRQREDQKERQRVAQLGDGRQRGRRVGKRQVVEQHGQQAGHEHYAQEARQLADRVTAERGSTFVHEHDHQKHRQGQHEAHGGGDRKADIPQRVAAKHSAGRPHDHGAHD